MSWKKEVDKLRKCTLANEKDVFRRIRNLEDLQEQARCPHEFLQIRRKESPGSFDLQGVVKTCVKCGFEKLQSVRGMTTKQKKTYIEIGLFYKWDFAEPMGDK